MGVFHPFCWKLGGPFGFVNSGPSDWEVFLNYYWWLVWTFYFIKSVTWNFFNLDVGSTGVVTFSFSFAVFFLFALLSKTFPQLHSPIFLDIFVLVLGIELRDALHRYPSPLLFLILRQGFARFPSLTLNLGTLMPLPLERQAGVTLNLAFLSF